MAVAVKKEKEVEDPYARFLSVLRLEGKAEESLRTYQKCLRKYDVFLKREKKVCTTDSLLDFFIFMSEKENLAPSTRKLYQIILKRYATYRKVEFPAIKLPNVENEVFKFMCKKDFQKLYDATKDDPMLRAQVSICYSSAMRINELVTRKMCNYDLENGRLFVSGKTGPSSDAWLPLTETAVTDAKNYLIWRDRAGLPKLSSTDYFFPRPEDINRPIAKTTMTNKLYSLCKRAGVKRCSWHKVRHSRATHLRQDKVDVADIQKLLRHKQIATTLRYACSDDNMLQEKIRGVGELNKE